MNLSRPEAVQAEPMLDAASPPNPKAPRYRLRAWSNRGRISSRDVCLHELIAAQAAESPQAVALVDGRERITYRVLDQAANRLAHRLRALGVTREQLVGVCASRSWRMVAALLAVLKAGGAYVPLDPKYPAPRLRAIARDAGLRLVVTESALSGLDVWPADG